MKSQNHLKKRNYRRCDKLNYDFDRMITLGKKILGDSWNIQYVNVETVAYELRAYKGLSMCNCCRG